MRFEIYSYGKSNPTCLNKTDSIKLGDDCSFIKNWTSPDANESLKKIDDEFNKLQATQILRRKFKGDPKRTDFRAAEAIYWLQTNLTGERVNLIFLSSLGPDKKGNDVRSDNPLLVGNDSIVYHQDTKQKFTANMNPNASFIAFSHDDGMGQNTLDTFTKELSSIFPDRFRGSLKIDKIEYGNAETMGQFMMNKTINVWNITNEPPPTGDQSESEGGPSAALIGAVVGGVVGAIVLGGVVATGIWHFGLVSSSAPLMEAEFVGGGEDGGEWNGGGHGRTERESIQMMYDRQW